VNDPADSEWEQLALLMQTQSEPEANIVKGILEESDIGCTFVAQVPHGIYPFTVDGLALIQIKVLASQLEAAQALLSDYKSKADIEETDLPEEDG
jgi:hypothetical protein